MKLTDVQYGEIFTIEETPSYPKLKIDGGYLDMRDEIVNKKGNCDNKECRIMTVGEVVKEIQNNNFIKDPGTEEEIKDWMGKLILEYAFPIE